jgi:hypothetical protein
MMSSDLIRSIALCSSIFAFLPTASNAALISSDLNSSGDGALTRDTMTVTFLISSDHSLLENGSGLVT